MSRWDSWHTAGPEVSTHLREQQCGPQHWQHAEHALLQQQHSVAQDRHAHTHTPGDVHTGAQLWHRKALTVHSDRFVDFLPLKELFWARDRKEKYEFKKERKHNNNLSSCVGPFVPLQVCADKCTVLVLLVCNSSETELGSLTHSQYKVQETNVSLYQAFLSNPDAAFF